MACLTLGADTIRPLLFGELLSRFTDLAQPSKRWSYHRFVGRFQKRRQRFAAQQRGPGTGLPVELAQRTLELGRFTAADQLAMAAAGARARSRANATGACAGAGRRIRLPGQGAQSPRPPNPEAAVTPTRPQQPTAPAPTHMGGPTIWP